MTLTPEILRAAARRIISVPRDFGTALGMAYAVERVGGRMRADEFVRIVASMDAYWHMWLHMEPADVQMCARFDFLNLLAESMEP